MPHEDARPTNPLYEQYLLQEQIILRDSLQKFSPIARNGVMCYALLLLVCYLYAPFVIRQPVSLDGLYIFAALLVLYQSYELVFRMVSRSCMRDISCKGDQKEVCELSALAPSYIEYLARKALPFHGLHGLLFVLWTIVAIWYLILQGIGYFENSLYPSHFLVSYGIVAFFYFIDFVLKGIFIWKIPEYILQAGIQTLLQSAGSDIFLSLIKKVLLRRFGNGKI